MEGGFNKHHLLGIRELLPSEIEFILNTADAMKEISFRDIKKVPTLRGKTVITFFYEPSTRTRTSFEIAAKRLSADTINISASTSSLVKGESLLDTARNLQAMQPDILIIRHPHAGAPHFLAKHINTAVINAGDGMHEHPTQALLDAMSIKEKKGTIEGLEIAIIGDITHSRVARSDILLFTKLRAKVRVAGPPTLIPPYIENLGAKVCPCIEDALEGADVVIALRVQRERLKQVLFPDLREYAIRFGLNKKRLALTKKDAVLMHPGPVNWGVELDPEVMDLERTIILNQVTNGVAVRMAILVLVAG
ncbi:MAG: aspartate carbamoyltransferase catalytic subunit [Candidatus Desulfofervidaceae bacterium]|nr:aspartate carbamoyltransferase catalytic subunit [Candidatus Desulfofervidaceae bacterium]MDL1970193.1 aspartate carbamoyltransferase catalytic subunit [Candidatus Desulfofervidaceae bacterium]